MISILGEMIIDNLKVIPMTLIMMALPALLLLETILTFLFADEKCVSCSMFDRSEENH